MSAPDLHTPSIPSFALAFVLVGVGFALPVYLFPEGTAAPLQRAPEILNLFCLVSWLGMSHFYFAYQGHGMALWRRSGALGKYIGLVTLSALGLAGLWMLLGAKLFSALAWSYFIAHLIKAEMYFSRQSGWLFFLQPLLAFSFFSFALLAPDEIVNPLNLFAGAAVCGLPFLFPFYRLHLKSVLQKGLDAPTRDSSVLWGSSLLISAFLVGEGLLWGRYRPWMTPEFRDGVYTVHVALASFYHYFKSYAHMQVRKQGGLLRILIVNAVVMVIGVLTLFLWRDSPLKYVFGFQYFTFWVWLHQWMSDVFNGLKASSLRKSLS